MVQAAKHWWIVPAKRAGLVVLLGVLVIACLGVAYGVGRPHAAAGLRGASSREIIWGKVSTCPCKGDQLGKVASAIEDARIGAQFELGQSNPEYRYFSISFDPRVVPRARLVEIVETNGGTIQDSPLDGDARP
jgi:hypothetical protein